MAAISFDPAKSGAANNTLAFSAPRLDER